MPVANTVPNSDRYVDYNPVVATTTFAVPFAIWCGSLAEAEGDIEVRIDGVPTTAFSVTGTLDTSSTPSVILDASVVLDVATDDTHVEIEGNGAARRIYQYSDGVGVAPRYQNSILNFCLATVRDIRQKISRSIRTPYGEAPLELPDAATRAEGFLYFDTAGDPTSVPSGNVETLAGIADEIVTVAAIAPDVTAVAAIDANVTTVAGISANVTTVAGIAANVTTVAGISANVTTVAGIAANVTTVAGIAANVSALAALATEISALYAIRVAISTVAADIAAVVTAAANVVNIAAVAAIDAAVTTVAGIAANVTAVAGNATNINAVAANEADIDAVAANGADIDTVAAAVAAVNTVSTNIADVNTVAANIATISAKLAKDGSEAMTGALPLTEVATPSTPASGLMKVYPKADKKLYYLDSDGVETEVGAGGGASGVPFVILTTGQSNMTLQRTYSWTPPSNLTLWDYDLTENDVGTAYVTPTDMSCAAAIGQAFALAYPERDVRVINISLGANGIAAWLPSPPGEDVWGDIVANVPDALTAAGVDKIDLLAWWQGESDRLAPSTYVADFTDVMDQFKAESWFPASTPTLIFGMSSEATSGSSTYGDMNGYLQECANADPQNRKYVHTASIPAAFWTDSPPIHMTAEGYEQAGYLAFLALDGRTEGVRSAPFVHHETSGNVGLGVPVPTRKFDVAGVVGTSGGVAFPATPVPSADVNTLDNYLEGTFTPTLTFGGAAVGMTFHGDTAGQYVKCGRISVFSLRIRLSAKGSSTGAAVIGGIPVNIALQLQSVVCGRYLNMASVSAGIIGYTGSLTIALLTPGATAPTALTDANFTNTSELFINGAIYASS